MSTIEIENAKVKDERDRLIFEQMMEQFWRRYAPDDKHEASRFAADLHSLVRQIYREAQEPAFKQLDTLIRALPIAPFLADPPRKAG
jgi:hypothetical protein